MLSDHARKGTPDRNARWMNASTPAIPSAGRFCHIESSHAEAVYPATETAHAATLADSPMPMKIASAIGYSGGQ